MRMPDVSAQICAVLAGLVFSLPGLDWQPLDHVEIFAGKAEVTRAMHKARNRSGCSCHKFFSHL